MELMNESDLSKMDIKDQKQYIIDIVSSLSNEDAKELYNFMMGMRNYAKKLKD